MELSLRVVWLGSGRFGLGSGIPSGIARMGMWFSH